MKIDPYCQRQKYRPMNLVSGNNCHDSVSQYINSFLNSHGLFRCDSTSAYHGLPTYVNFGLNHQSCLDFILSSKIEETSHFKILDPNMNFSDHYPLIVSVLCSFSAGSLKKGSSSNSTPYEQYFLRWDKADVNSYYYYTGH